MENEDENTRDLSVANRLAGDSSLLTHVTRRAMATEFAVILPARWAHTVELVVDTLEQLEEIEQALTIYRDSSEIAKVNCLAAEQPVELSAATFELLQKSVVWSIRTQGAFDVTAGALVEAWGFTKRSGRKPTPDEIEVALNRVGYQGLILNDEKRSVEFANPGMSINMGAIGKGDALDRLANRLSENGVTDFLIHGGSSSVIAKGDQIEGSGLGWAVGIAHPTKPKRRLAGVWLRGMALATSGSGKQFFHHKGKRYGHVIDPRTGYPAGDLMSLTVLMPSAADADACATGLFVAGSQEIAALFNQHEQGVHQQGTGEHGKGTHWVGPMVLARRGDRQDAVELVSHGDVPWVQEEQWDQKPDEGKAEDVSRP